jgi:hypothetical protein
MNEENNLNYYGGALSSDGSVITTTGGDYVAGTLTGSDTIITTTGDYVIESGNLMYNSYCLRNDSHKMDFKLPEVFLKAVKKTIPNIKNLLVLDSNVTISQYSDSVLNRLEFVKVNLMVILNEDLSDDYASKINDIFLTMFPAYGFVTLSIIQFDFEDNKKFNKLMELFG